MILTRVTAESIIQSLPQPVLLGEEDLDTVDLYIGALGFEDRSAAVAQRLDARHVSVQQAIIAVYPRNAEDNDRLRPFLEGALSACGAQVAWAEIASGRFVAALTSALESWSHQEPASVCLDVSSMSGSLILGSLRALSMFPEISLRIVYTEAKEYGPSLEQYRNELLRRDEDGSITVDHGVGSIRFSVDFEGSHVPGLGDLVVVVPGFGRDRARAAISYVNPAYLLAPNGHVKWIIGRPRSVTDSWREGALRELHGIAPADTWGVVDDFDYCAMIECLESLYLDSQFKTNLTLAPFGTKLHGVAIGLFCLMRPAVRVLVVDPESYRTQEYSRGLGDSWSINFGSVGALLTRLRSVDKLEAARAD